MVLLRTLCLVLFALLLCQSAGAENMQVEAGKWEFTTKSVQLVVRTDVSTTCIEDDRIPPSVFLEDNEECSVKELETTSASMSFTMVCSAQGHQMTGKAKLTSTGKAVAGTMKVQGDAGGMKMTFEQHWEAST